ncbi:MAG: hypothetical protein ACP5US_11890 [Candidatus Kryptoniota bacterium]
MAVQMEDLRRKADDAAAEISRLRRQLVNFWRLEAHNAGGELSLRNIAPYATSKLTKFVQNQYVTPIVSQQHSTNDFRDILDNRKILLVVKLTKGKLGQLGTRLLGRILCAMFLIAALSREDTSQEQKDDFTPFAEEVQSFVSDSLELILSEVRKYRLSFVLANLTLGQLRPSTLKAPFGNMGGFVFFKPGIHDVTMVKPCVWSPFVKEELLNMPNFVVVSRLMMDNMPSFPFLLNTLLPEMLK